MKMDLEEPTIDSLIRLLKTLNEPKDVAENVVNSTSLILSCSITNVEDLFKYVMPAISQSIKQIYTKNTASMKSESVVSQNIKNNLQVALTLTHTSDDIVSYVLKHETVSVELIPSVPVYMAEILLLTFEHCKNSQKVYQSTLKSVSEILDLFKKTQEIHSKFLNLMDNCLVFDFLNEDNLMIFKNVLEILINLSEMLADLNTKSMADNWKGFISLIQKSSHHFTECSHRATKCLTAEISTNMQSINELGFHDLKKSLQALKINGFLIKVALKLFEINSNITEHFDVLLNFCLVVYSWRPEFFQNNNFPTEFQNTVNNIYINTDPFVNQLFFEKDFVKNFCSLNGYDKLLLRYGFGFLNLANKLMNCVPEILTSILDKNEIISLLNLVFTSSENCYKEFLYDKDSRFYEELVINISVTVLCLSDVYTKIENLLLQSVIQDKVWTTMLAIDVWCTILKQSSISLRRQILNNLIVQIQDLNIGIFIQTPATIHLKILSQRIFKTLPNHILNEQVSTYNPSENKLVWKFLSLRNIPLAQRYHTELILTDLYEKMKDIEREDSSLSEIMLLLENMDLISYVAFNDLEISTSRMAFLITNLWSFDVSEISCSNNFAKHFIHKLFKLTVALTKDLTTDHLILIINQLKQLFVTSSSLFKLLSCEIIQAISKRNFNNCSKKATLFSLLSDVFHLLLADRNAILVQMALETFDVFSKNDSYTEVINKVSAQSDIKKLIVNYMRENSAQHEYSVKYLDKICDLKFKHSCLEWTDSPQSKKLKVENNADLVISKLKSISENLVAAVSKSQLNSVQVAEIKSVIRQLETLV